MVAMAALLAAGASHAASVTLTAREALGSASGPGADVMDGNANGGDFFHSGSDGAGNATFFHTYGTVGGLTYFGARASGQGTFFASTRATYRDQYVNTSGVAQQVTFSFNVDSGQATMAGSGSGYADLLLQLTMSLDGAAASTVASAHARTETGAGDTCMVAGSGVLAGYLSCGSGASASGDAGAYSVTQWLAAGSTLDVVYGITAETAGTLVPSTAAEYCSHGGREWAPQGDGPRLVQEAAVAVGDGMPGSSGCTFFNGLARSGDPAGFTPFTPGGFGVSPANAVPEPGPLALLTAALGLLAASSARRRRG